MISKIMTAALLSVSLMVAVPAMAAEKEAKAETITLKCVKGGCNDTGQCCGFCEGSLTKALKSVKGVEKVSMNKKEKTFTVKPKEGKLDLAALKAAAEKAGYKVEEKKVPEKKVP